MDQILKDANEKAAQAEFVCIDSCNDKDGKLYKPTRLASPSVFTPSPKPEVSPPYLKNISPDSPNVAQKNSAHEGIYKRRLLATPLFSGNSEPKNVMPHKVASSYSKKKREPERDGKIAKYIILAITIVAVCSTAGLLIFTGCSLFRIVKTRNSPFILDTAKPMDRSDAGLFFKKDPSGDYKLRDSVTSMIGTGRKFRQVVKVPLTRLSLKATCGEPFIEPKFAVNRYGVATRYAFCRWIIQDQDSVIRECVLRYEIENQAYSKLFGGESFCRLDFELPGKAELIVSPKPVSFISRASEKVLKAGEKLYGGIKFATKRIVRSTKITYHRTVIALKVLLNYAEPRVKFLGGAAQTFAKDTVWHNIKDGSKQAYKRVSALFGRVM